MRIIAATSRVGAGQGADHVQEALLGRLGAQPIQLPALRERIEDLGRLGAHFLRASPTGAASSPRRSTRCAARLAAQRARAAKVITEAEVLSRSAPAIGFEHLPPASPRWSRRGLRALGDVAAPDRRTRSSIRGEDRAHAAAGADAERGRACQGTSPRGAAPERQYAWSGAASSATASPRRSDPRESWRPTLDEPPRGSVAEVDAPTTNGASTRWSWRCISAL